MKLCADWEGLPSPFLQQLANEDLSILWATRGTCRSWRNLACAPAQGPPPSSLTLSWRVSAQGLLGFLTGTCLRVALAHLTSISCSSVVPMGRACAVYTGIASCCPQLQSLTLNLEGGLDGWTGVDLLPRCLTSLSLATRHCEAKLPLRLFNVFLQLQHLHLTLDCTETCGIAIITGVLHLPAWLQA